MRPLATIADALESAYLELLPLSHFRQSAFSRMRKKANSAVTQDGRGPYIHARRRRTTEWRIRLHFGRTASPSESSAETAPEDGGPGVGGTLAALRQDVRQAGPTIDCAGETAAGTVAAGAVHHPQ